MIYLPILESALKRGNKLEETFYSYLEELDRVVVPDNKLEKFKSKVLEQMEGLNESFKRCKPLHGHWITSNDDKDLLLVDLPFASTFRTCFTLYGSTDPEVIYPICDDCETYALCDTNGCIKESKTIGKFTFDFENQKEYYTSFIKKDDDQDAPKILNEGGYSI